MSGDAMSFNVMKYVVVITCKYLNASYLDFSVMTTLAWVGYVSAR